MNRKEILIDREGNSLFIQEGSNACVAELELEVVDQEGIIHLSYAEVEELIIVLQNLLQEGKYKGKR